MTSISGDGSNQWSSRTCDTQRCFPRGCTDWAFTAWRCFWWRRRLVCAGRCRKVLDPTPFLAFYLAWVAAAAFGGLGPGLLATAASWVCIDLLLDSTRWRMNLGDPVIMARFVIFVAGGVAVSLVAEAMRRGRLRLARIECNSNGRRSSCRVKPRSCRCRPRN